MSCIVYYTLTKSACGGSILCSIDKGIFIVDGGFPFVCICYVLEMKDISLVLLVLYCFHLVTVKGFHIGK